jgi:hypothetical protein
MRPRFDREALEKPVNDCGLVRSGAKDMGNGRSGPGAGRVRVALRELPDITRPLIVGPGWVRDRNDVRDLYFEAQKTPAHRNWGADRLDVP